MLRALATNDDGVWSLGLRLLVESLRLEGFEVEVYAPLGDWSGSSKCVGKVKPVSVYEALISGVKAYAINAPPALCAELALLSRREFDVVVSGINNGPNIGVYDFFSSGTIGAGIEAALRGVPSLAVSSYCGDDLRDYTRECMEPAARLAARLATAIASSRPDTYNLVIINAPKPPWKGVTAANLYMGVPWLEASIRGFVAKLPRLDRRKFYLEAPKGSDARALMEGYVSIVAVRFESDGVKWGVKGPEVDKLLSVAWQAARGLDAAAEPGRGAGRSLQADTGECLHKGVMQAEETEPEG